MLYVRALWVSTVGQVSLCCPCVTALRVAVFLCCPCVTALWVRCLFVVSVQQRCGSGVSLLSVCNSAVGQVSLSCTCATALWVSLLLLLLFFPLPFTDPFTTGVYEGCSEKSDQRLITLKR